MIEQLLPIKVRRLIGFIIDYIVISILSYPAVYSVFKSGLLKYDALPRDIIPLLNQTVTLAVGIIYYLLFWCVLKSCRTPGQLICLLRIEKPAKINQCLKRVLLMNIATIYFWITSTVIVSLYGESENISTYMSVIIFSTAAIQFVYAYFINGVEKITGIKVVVSKFLPIKVRRFIAFTLDYIAISVLTSTYISILSKARLLNYYLVTEAVIHFVNSIFIVGISGVYYLLFWCFLKSCKTPGQLICLLRIEKPAKINQCLKRVLLMNMATIYFWIASTVIGSVHILSGNIKPYSMFVIMLSAIAIQSVYAYFINGVDKVTGIKVVNR